MCVFCGDGQEPPKWIWDGGEGTNRYVHLRKSFDLTRKPGPATLRIAADGRYICWVNGQRVGQGPVPYRPPHFPVDSYQVGHLLQPGRNVVAILGHAFGIPIHTGPSTGAGVLVELDVENGPRLASGSDWKVAPASAWLHRNQWGYGFKYAYRRDAARAVGFPDLPFAADYELVRGLVARGASLAAAPDDDGVVIHVMQPSSTSRCFPQARVPPARARALRAFAVDGGRAPDVASGP